MVVRACSFLCLSFLLVAAVIAGESKTSREDDSYAQLLCAVLESSNSGDPEIRSNVVVEGLAYLDGEAADVLRVLLLIKEGNPTIRDALATQLSQSRRKSSAVDCLRHLTENVSSQKQKSLLQAVLQQLGMVETAVIVRGEAKVHEQPAKYVGPLSSADLKTLYDGESRIRICRELASQPGRSSTEILRLFRSVETDARRAEELDRQILGREDARGQPLR